MRQYPHVDKSKIITIGANCAQRCPVCLGPCLGGAEEYLWRHCCLDLHQWQTGRAA